MTATCLACNQEMEYSAQIEEKNIPVCNNPSCKNYGLLAISKEMMERSNG